MGLVLLWNIPTHARQGTTRQAAAHFLEQATFGPTAADVDLILTSGYDQWLNNQFGMPESPMPDDPDVNDVRNQLFMNMASGQDQLRQRMVFALSQVLVISANKNGNGNELAPFVRLLSRHAFGNFRTLIREMTIHPAMGKYLDNWLNRCTRNTTTCPNGSTTSVPNENYARELLQLFTLGLWELNQNGTVRLNAVWSAHADLQPGHARRVCPSPHRLDLRAHQRCRRLPARHGAGHDDGNDPAPRYHDPGRRPS